MLSVPDSRPRIWDFPEGSSPSESLVGHRDFPAHGRTPKTITIGTYDSDLAQTVAEADFIFEAVAEDLSIKQQVFALIDRVRAMTYRLSRR